MALFSRKSSSLCTFSIITFPLINVLESLFLESQAFERICFLALTDTSLPVKFSLVLSIRRSELLTPTGTEEPLPLKQLSSHYWVRRVSGTFNLIGRNLPLHSHKAVLLPFGHRLRATFVYSARQNRTLKGAVVFIIIRYLSFPWILYFFPCMFGEKERRGNLRYDF